MGTGRLFPKGLAPRRPRVIRMHVVDAGNGEESMVAEFECKRCGHNSGWVTIETVTEGRRGIPCPKCNAEKATA